MNKQMDKSKVVGKMKGLRYPTEAQSQTQLPAIGKDIGPMINVHQHFNQPNITNVNHNSFYISKEGNGTAPSTQAEQLNLVMKNRKEPMSLKGRKMNKLYMSSQPQIKQHKQATTAGENAWMGSEEEAKVVPRNQNEFRINKQGSKKTYKTLREKDSHQLNEQQVVEYNNLLNEMSESPNKDSAALTKAITAQAKFFNKMSLDRRILPPRRMLAGLPTEEPKLPN